MSVFFRRRCLLVVIALAALSAGAPVTAAPSWWRVSNGRAEVWILGAPRIEPRNFGWDTRAAEQRLSGANAVIIGPRARGALKGAGLVLSSLSLQPLESTLPPSLERRFAVARQSIGQPAARYAAWRPAAAAKQLLDDFLAANDLQQGGVEDQMVKLAHRHGVRDQPAGEYDPQRLFDEAKTLSFASQLTCLEASVHDVERGAGVIRGVAADWAGGGLADAPIDPIDRACVETLPAIDAQAENTLNEESAAVAHALTSSGRTVAVFELKNMTERGGVADRLKAMGLAVSGPTP